MGRWSPALIRQVDRWTQQLHLYLLIDVITVCWSAAHRGLPGSLIALMELSYPNALTKQSHDNCFVI